MYTGYKCLRYILSFGMQQLRNGLNGSIGVKLWNVSMVTLAQINEEETIS